MPPERRLAAIMFTDIVGYTALMAESEEKGLRVRARHRELVRPLVERYHGEWIESPGDQTLSTFLTALDAVDCGLAVLARLEGDAELRLHIGVHLGDLVVAEGEITGDGVNIAARLCPLSKGSDLCVSGEVYRSVRNQPGIEATALGEQKLKNVPEPVAVYSVTGTAAAPSPVAKPVHVSRGRGSLRAALAVAALVVIAIGAGWWLYRPAATLSPIRSIAVLPLENLSGYPEQEYFADGMTEALIGELAKVGSISVISRTSVVRYKQSDKSLPEIAEELNVDGIVEGTVIREGSRVRVTAQLIDARSDTHLWAERYDRELSSVLALHSEVARAVAEQVRLELGPEERAALRTSRAVDPRAYDAYLRGLHIRGTAGWGEAWAPRAIEQFEQAVALDPDFAEGFSALAQARGSLGIVGYGQPQREELLSSSREAMQRALELDDRLASAHATLGHTRLWLDWDFPGARRSFERALQLSPSDPIALDGYAAYLLYIEGRSEEALDLAERLLRVAPFDVFYRGNRVQYFLSARLYERALEEFERLQELAPAFVSPPVWLTYFMLGRLEEAHRVSVAVYKRCGRPCDSLREALESGWNEGGWEGAQRAWLEVAREGAAPFGIATRYALIGEKDEAFAWLERGYRERDPLMIVLRTAPYLDPLRSDPRFQDLLRRIGFPED